MNVPLIQQKRMMDGKMEGSFVKFLLYPRLKLTLVN